MARKVKWSIRDDGNSTWGRHFHGDYVVTVTDCDGDMTEWAVWERKYYERKTADVQDHEIYKGRLAYGTICHGGDEFEIGQAVAIEALDGIIRDLEERRVFNRASRDGENHGR